MTLHRPTPRALGLLAILTLLIALMAWRLEADRAGISITSFDIDGTPVTVYRYAVVNASSDRPLAILAHGFSGSRTMVEALSLALAREGFIAVSLDLPGHGDSHHPMNAEIREIHGATRQMMGVVGKVTDFALDRFPTSEPVTLIGHSMATDIVVRRAAEDARVGPVVVVSMYSEAVTADHPKNLLAITGEYEPGLRQAALSALRQLDPAAAEGDVVERSEGSKRRAALVAPAVGHVGVLFSDETQAYLIEWLNRFYHRPVDKTVSTHVIPSAWAAGLLLTAIFLTFAPLCGFLGPKRPTPAKPSTPLWPALILPPLLTPFPLLALDATFIPMLGMSYLTAHMGLQGLLTLGLLWRAGVRPSNGGWSLAVLLVLYAVGVQAALIDRYFSDFLPSPERWLPLALTALGAVPFMLGESLLLKARDVPAWWRFAARGLTAGGLAIGIALAPDDRLLIGFFLPVVVLFYLVFGSMARWIGQRRPAPTALGIAQGLLLAYSLAAVVPMVGP